MPDLSRHMLLAVHTHSYAKQNKTEWRVAASTCLEHLRITAKQFDFFGASAIPRSKCRFFVFESM